MNDAPPPDLEAAKSFIAAALQLINDGAKEEVLKQNLVSHLPRIFPGLPSWVDHHVRGAESMVGYAVDDQERRGFIDNLVGNTTIEYEPNLNSAPTFNRGFSQVREHLAGRLNAGAPVEQLIGVLSDTVRWRAYRVAPDPGTEASKRVDPTRLELVAVSSIDLSSGSDLDAKRLVDFLVRHLGREASRPLTADNIAYDLGFESRFCRRHLTGLSSVVTEALSARPDYGTVIEQLWGDFVSYLGDGRSTPRFDQNAYTSELYLVTLAKLLCANVIAERGLLSGDDELVSILDGSYFKSRGLQNLVEYDYFGWINDHPFVSQLVSIARALQSDLRAYDFESPVSEDLFGGMLAQLARRLQRLLLGQEFTPQWLAAMMASHLVELLPNDEQPRFLDMCCGSGSFLVEVLKLAKERLASTDADGAKRLAELVQVATGFDVDPLAVMLAKVNWVIATRDWLAPFDGSRLVSIPIYLADSLFGKTPLGDVDASSATFELSLLEQPIDLPAFLVTPERRRLFDSLLDHAYTLGMAAADESVAAPAAEADTAIALNEAVMDSQGVLSDDEQPLAAAFFQQLVDALASLQRRGLNGIWAFVLRNSYRPALVAGQFNGIISNPPWLALSKVANNPYSSKLRSEAEHYSLKPPGPAHLHIELATTFLLHAVDHYLRGDGVIACVLPDTVLNGYQHSPFRKAAYAARLSGVPLDVSELWRISRGTFKNEAIVLFGSKRGAATRPELTGQRVSPDGANSLRFRVVTLGDRVAWSDSADPTYAGWFSAIQLRQGADIMPRTLIFFEVSGVDHERSRLTPIDPSRSQVAYLVNEGKRLTDFKLTPVVVPNLYLFDVLLSKHLVPFNIGTPAKGFLPIDRDDTGTWSPVSDTRLAATPGAHGAFREILRALTTDAKRDIDTRSYFALLDSDRRKLSTQRLAGGNGYLVLQGAGGSAPCAAYVALSDLDSERLIIDQTLYWAIVPTEDEALYITGAFNSEAVEEVIRDFQARGQFGRRHVHELPAKVTPGFDPTQAGHQAVVDTTRALLAELDLVRTDGNVARCFDTAGALAGRRRRLRTQVLPTLPSFQAYAAVCRELYGLV